MGAILRCHLACGAATQGIGAAFEVSMASGLVLIQLLLDLPDQLLPVLLKVTRVVADVAVLHHKHLGSREGPVYVCDGVGGCDRVRGWGTRVMNAPFPLPSLHIFPYPAGKGRVIRCATVAG